MPEHPPAGEAPVTPTPMRVRSHGVVVLLVELRRSFADRPVSSAGVSGDHQFRHSYGNRAGGSAASGTNGLNVGAIGGSVMLFVRDVTGIRVLGALATYVHSELKDQHLRTPVIEYPRGGRTGLLVNAPAQIAKRDHVIYRYFVKLKARRGSWW